MAKRKYIDWDSIEPLYRAGQLTLMEICDQYEIDHKYSQVWKKTVTNPAIIKQAKIKSWKKNLANKIKERISNKLVRNLVRDSNKADADNDENIIEAAANTAAAVAKEQIDRLSCLLKIQDELRDTLEKDEELAIAAKIRSFKDLSVTVRALHEQQAERYHLNDQAPGEIRIKVTRASANA